MTRRQVQTASIRLLALLLVAWGIGCIAGCTSLPVSGPRGSELSITPAARIAPAAPWTINPQDSSIARGDNGLHLADPVGASDIEISSTPPTALAWSSDGKFLGAALRKGDSARLAIFSRQGKLIAETGIPGMVTAISWLSPTELIALAVDIHTFSFGGAVTASLYRWDGTAPPQATRLFDTTVKPLTLRQGGERVATTISLAVSPERDEMLYTSLHDPPAFSPYLRIVLRNLESGAEREVATVGLSSGGARFVGNGDRIIYGDGTSTTTLVDPWSSRVIRTFPAPGKQLATSLAGEYLLIDGRLYQGDTEIASFPPTVEGSFAPGGGLYVRHDTAIYRIGGLAERVSAPLPPAVAERLRTLRRWRSEGLITDREYREQRERITAP